MEPFVQTIARSLEALFPPEGLLLATSAGADSTALLGALVQARRRRALRHLRLVLGHVRHHLRSSEETAADEAVVREHARTFGLEILIKSVRVGDAGGLEQAARDARYAALVEMAQERELGAVVTGHTGTDQAETLLFRLLRGAGARGLGAMPPDRALGPVRLLRPMLGVTREEARAFCRTNGLAFRDDPTNAEPRPRMRLRDDVLPVLEDISPGATLRLARAAERLRADDAFLEAEAACLGSDANVDTLQAMPEALLHRVLVQWCERALGTRRRLTSRHLEALVHLVREGRGEVALPGAKDEEQVARVVSGRLVLVPCEPLNPSHPLERPSHGVDEALE